MRRGKTFIVSGPSGVGKSTVLGALLERQKNLYFSVSATTRQPRPGEENGVHYHFLTLDTFREWIAQDEFLEYAEFVGNYYGTPKKYVYAAMDEGKDVILDIEVQGANQVAEKMPEAIRVFIAPPSWSELERRLVGRGTDAPDKIQKRLQRAKEDFSMAQFYDYFVINDTVDHAVAELEAILTAEHCKVQERVHEIGKN